MLTAALLMTSSYSEGLTLFPEADQRGRFLNLLLPVLIFIACVVQLRLVRRADAGTDDVARTSSIVRALSILVTFVHRFFWIEG